MKLKLAVLLSTAALAAPAAAQSSTSTSAQGSTSSTQSSTPTSGVVVSSTRESLVVRMDDGTSRTFSVNGSTMLPGARLAEGNRVSVHSRTLESGLFEASRIELGTAVNRDRQAPTPSDRSMTSETSSQGMTAAQRETDAMQRDATAARQTAAMQGDTTATRQTAAMQRDTTATQRETMATQRETDAQRAGARADADADRETLPATASPMPLLALAGLGALVAGLVMKSRRTA